MAAVQGALLSYILWKYFTLDVWAWNALLNAKLPLIWVQVSVPLLILFGMDWISRGRTIQTILDIHKDSTIDHKIIAALFLLGIFLGTVWACKGGF